MKQTLRWGLPALALFLSTAAGCRPFEPATPPGFVDLSDHYEDHEYRATTADGVVLGVRSYANDPKGELPFWTRAIENGMRNSSGYALLETRKVQSRDGTPGTQLRFGHDEGREPHLYILTVFVNDDRVFVVEAGGARSEMERLMPQVDWSIANFLAK